MVAVGYLANGTNYQSKSAVESSAERELTLKSVMSCQNQYKGKKARAGAVALWYASRFNYDANNRGLEVPFSKGGVMYTFCEYAASGICGLYEQLGYKATTVQGKTHTWVEVKVDGKWWRVEATRSLVEYCNKEQRATCGYAVNLAEHHVSYVTDSGRVKFEKPADLLMTKKTFEKLQ